MGHLREECINILTHGMGALLSVAALIVLVVFSAHASAWNIVSVSIFGASLILLYMASSGYHLVPTFHRLKRLFQRLDRAAIFIAIAGTYTAFALGPLRGPWGWSLFGAVWGLALIGIILRFLPIRVPEWLSLGLYVLLGWVGLIALSPLRANLPPESLLWLVLGGILYTLGALAFALERKMPCFGRFGMHEAFHIFVLLGSASHFGSLLFYLS